jgi:hypothetical protein
MARERSVTVYGTVMATRLDGRHTIHTVEATAPGGSHIDLVVIARKRHRGSVRVAWDPNGYTEPRFIDGLPWGLIGLTFAIIATIVVVGWLVLA